MAFVKESGYTLPGADEPLTHARILHAGNRYAATNDDAGTTAVASASYSKAAPLNGLTYERWKPNAATSTYEIDLGHSQPVTCACIGAHTIGSTGATVTLQYDDGGWQDVVATTPPDDSPIFFLFAQVGDRNWRLNITGGAPEIGIFWVGKPLQMERPIYGGFAPPEMNRNTIVRGVKSQTGQWLGRSTIRSSLQGSASWAHLSASWVRTNIGGTSGLIRSLESEPFFMAWRPDTFAAEVVLGWTNTRPSAPSNMGIRDLMTFGFDFEAYAYE